MRGERGERREVREECDRVICLLLESAWVARVVSTSKSHLGI